MRIAYSSDVEVIRPLAEKWAGQCNGSALGIDVSVDTAVKDLAHWLDTVPGTILLAYDGVELVGFFALFAIDSFLGMQKVALERYWYAVPNRVRAGPALYRAAQEWAKANECTHLMISASNLASDQYEKVAKFCEKMGMQLFETAYAGRV